MAWNSTLKRNTPLKAMTPLKSKRGFKPPCGFNKSPTEKLPKKADKSPQEAQERPKTPKRSERSSLETHLDIVFSLYIRLRDAMDGGRCRCISCGRVFPFEQIQCGHYYTRHNRSVRWDERNCNAQCVACNCNEHGNLEGYKPNLIAKIGQQQLDELNVIAHQSRKWSGEELRQMVRHYTAEVKRLSKEKGVKVRL